jgi:hypothetical protein
MARAGEEHSMKNVVTIVLGIIALVVLFRVLKFVLGMFFGLVHFGMTVLWLALIVTAVIFIVGIFRRMLRI